MNIAQALKGVHSIYVDTAPLIYLVEDHEKYGAIVDQIFLLAETLRINLKTNVITVIEVLHKPIRENESEIEAKYREMLIESGGIELVEISKTVAERAARLRATYNLRTPDALHIATALTTGCDLFLTNDFGLKRIQELRILVIDDLEIEAQE